MACNVVHFDIHCDDVERARRFYAAVFGWRFEAWGPPDYYLIRTGTDDDPGIHGSLSKRARPLADGDATGFECTVAVDSLPEIARAVEAAGGRVTLGETEITGVGRLIRFEDPERNPVCAMVYQTPPGAPGRG